MWLSLTTTRRYACATQGEPAQLGELSRQEGGKVLAGSRNTVAIFLGIKDPK